MPGFQHDPKLIERMVVLIEQSDGRRYGYEVRKPTMCTWRWTGVDANGSTARVVVEGSFHRKGRQEVIDEQAAIEAGAKEIEA